MTIIVVVLTALCSLGSKMAYDVWSDRRQAKLRKAQPPVAPALQPAPATPSTTPEKFQFQKAPPQLIDHGPPKT